MSCKFLERFAAIAVERKLVVIQYWLGEIDQRVRPARALALLECARDLDLQVLDLFDTFQLLLAERPASVEALFFGREHGHMTAQGNELVAGAIAEVLGGSKRSQTRSVHVRTCSDRSAVDGHAERQHPKGSTRSRSAGALFR